MYPNVPKSIREFIALCLYHWSGFYNILNHQQISLHIVGKNNITVPLNIVQHEKEDKFKSPPTITNNCYILLCKYDMMNLMITDMKVLFIDPQMTQKYQVQFKCYTIPITETMFDKLLNNALILTSRLEIENQ